MRGPFSSLVVPVIVAALAGAVGARWLAPSNGVPVAQKESAYEQVIRTNTLRCGYWVFPPSTIIDPNTGKLDGFSIAVAKEMARRLNLDIKWVEEVTFGTMLAGLETQRYDAVCPGAFITAGRSRHAESTVPIVYNGLVPVVRANDTRFDTDLSRANNQAVTVSAMDGDVTAEIAALRFPQAKKLFIAQNGNYTDVYLNIANKKADMFFEEPGRIFQYLEKNPGQLKMLKIDQPLRISPWSIAVAKGEHDLVGLLNGALIEMLYDGSIRDIAKKYEPLTKGYYFFRPPLETGGLTERSGKENPK